MRPQRKFVWAVLALLCTSLPAPTRAQARASCEERSIDPASYALTTRAQARIVTDPWNDWWDGFDVGTAFEDLADLNASSTSAAERGRALDPHNLLAHGLLARQYVVTGQDARDTDAEWATVLDNGGAVVWTATLYDVDAKSYFLLAFDRSQLRIYRYGELAGAFETQLGMPKVVDEAHERFWRAWAGCIDPAARPEAAIPWSDVNEIKAGNWVLSFKLNTRVTITSDRGKKKTLNEIKVNLHGGTGSIEVHTTEDPIDPWKTDVRTMAIGPLDYQQRIRSTLVKFVDPDGRIKLPKASRSAGW
jgi:hypothetical protein